MISFVKKIETVKNCSVTQGRDSFQDVKKYQKIINYFSVLWILKQSNICC